MSATHTLSLPPAHANNFDFLRIVAAVAVLVSHHFPLSARPEWSIPMLSTSIGFVAVLVFFSISGYLVAQSWFADPCLWRFLLRRFLRVWPGLTVVVALCAMVFGPFLSTLVWREYFTHPEVWTYFQYLIMMPKNDHLPGVFLDNPFYAPAVNGSLWTIAHEVRCYLLLAALGLVGLLRSRRWLLGCLAVFAVWHISAAWSGQQRPVGWMLTEYFLMGTLMQATQALWLRRRALVSALSLVVFFGLWPFWPYEALLLTLPVWVILFGSSKTPVLHRAGRWGDFSYGVYIWAFPVQQFIIGHTFVQWPFWLSMSVSLLVTLVLAALSWHWVEKPALRWKPFRPAHPLACTPPATKAAAHPCG